MGKRFWFLFVLFGLLGCGSGARQEPASLTLDHFVGHYGPVSGDDCKGEIELTRVSPLSFIPAEESRLFMQEGKTTHTFTLEEKKSSTAILHTRIEKLSLISERGDLMSAGFLDEWYRWEDRLTLSPDRRQLSRVRKSWKSLFSFGPRYEMRTFTCHYERLS